jgi:aminoglycoside phosphotransferase family enzyme/predicted kinase
VKTTEDRPRLIDTAAVVGLLRRPATYDPRPARVECIETHISWVFLTDRMAYKLKKPVRFDFLDFSTSERRHEACEQEVRLNRRLAPHVYLAVVPITAEPWGLRLGGTGPAVDWVVKMRRLPADRALDQLILSNRVTADDVRQIGRTLARFYQQLPPLPMRPQEYRLAITQHVQGNWRELLEARHGLDAFVVRRVHEAQTRLLQLAPELFDNRVLDGRIVDGHGDLRPEHIYLAPLPTIIDCVEFNAGFRQLDVLDELCFLAMECADLGAEWIGRQVLDCYYEMSGDQAETRLLSFYKSYRACVRAKVSTLRAQQLAGPQRRESLINAEQYLRLADRFARELGPPLFLVVRGLTGTGKSTLAKVLGDKLGIEHLQTDAIRRELFGASPQPAGYNEGIYQEQNRARVYDEMLRRAGSMLADRRSVILDGTFLSAAVREKAFAMAKRFQATPLLVRCSCPDDVAIDRITARRRAAASLAESHAQIYLQQKLIEEPDPTDLPVIQVETRAAPCSLLDTVMTQLKASWASASSR